MKQIITLEDQQIIILEDQQIDALTTEAQQAYLTAVWENLQRISEKRSGIVFLKDLYQSNSLNKAQYIKRLIDRSIRESEYYKRLAQEEIYRLQCQEEIYRRKRQEELDRKIQRPWNELKTSEHMGVILTKLERELLTEGSIAQKLGEPFEALIKHFRVLWQLDGDIESNDWHGWEGRKYSETDRAIAAQLSPALDATIGLLFTGTVSLEQYKDVAQKMHGNSPFMRCTGGLMLILGAAIIALGILLIPIAPALSISIGIITGGVGLGLFYTGRKKGLYQAMSELSSAEPLSPSVIN